ncbi:5-oxoprolinase subunit B family protein [Streptomyces sp. TR06-5]|uniref:5-oxoprolinase subunit B family protein n=1 Tax=unclassified Streptomyces TaxID=2593676 RepID=UPI00399F5941
MSRAEPGPTAAPVVLPVGDDGLLVELPAPDDARAFHAELLRRRARGALPPVREIVPGARTVLLEGLAEPGRLAAELPRWEVPPAGSATGALVRVPVRYDGPDLPDVAAAWGVSRREVVRVHAETEFRVAFCGFAPGFGYLAGLDEKYEVPRRARPRTRVPANAVGLAGPYTGIYPRASPGGWQLVGTALDVVLWDPDRSPAALLAPGTRVRFEPVAGAS